MKIENLKLFLLVAQSKSISQAAEAAFISPQNLSFILRQVEKELGVQLFVRSNHGIALSKSGEQFLDYARKIVDTYDAFLQLQQIQSVHNVVHLYTTPTLGSHLKSLQGYSLGSGQYLSIERYSLDVLLSMLQDNKEGCYFIAVRGEMANKLSTAKDKIVVAQSNMHVKVCHKDNPILQADIAEQQKKCIYMFDNCGWEESYYNTIMVDDFEMGKKLMREKNFVYITSTNLFQLSFKEDEWVVLEETENDLTMYTLFFNYKDTNNIMRKSVCNELGILLKQLFAQ